jgi:predicted component of type VI protein secretion system
MSTWIECRYDGDLQRVVLGNDTISIGRGATCEISVPGDKEVSRIHATIERKDKAWFLADNKSTNGTFLNGQRVTVGHILQDGDVIQVGEQWIYVKEWVEPEASSERPIGSFSPSNYYAVLRLPKHATKQQIDWNYMELSRIYDPILHNFSSLASELKAELDEAYDTLGKPEKRSAYDAVLAGTVRK